VPRVTSNPIYSFFATPRSLGAFFLRMSLAAIFFYHGMRFTTGWFGGAGWESTVSAWTSASGLPYFIIACVLWLEVILAVSLFLGFLTRLSGFAVAFIMAGSIFLMHQGITFAIVEYPLLVIAAGLALVSSGGGSLSIDRGISNALLPEVG